MTAMQAARRTLSEVFGYDSFRPGQESVVAAILQGRDVMAVMPTGAGKSLCYQIPSLVLDGVTLVVSPLISLMRDQVSALLQNGVRAAYLNSSLTSRQFALALDNARRGVYRIMGTGLSARLSGCRAVHRAPARQAARERVYRDGDCERAQGHHAPADA